MKCEKCGRENAEKNIFCENCGEALRSLETLGDELDDDREYTAGQLAMCLGAAAVMAIAAGIFAGLYFLS